ncbi:hypothetical protein IV203_034015 [Nitzschia inconspicua]|uniref:Uncharacterized protein n=1 Tax=Nitzschia inconspicua TaxID=303405 RepID=A0A9K3M712_9STRA|nr:hypothetical protein IV203_034015 [Nitzschia inconspicua]
MQKTQMSEDAFADINWQSHERSVNTFIDGPHIFLVKFLHGWLPVGKVISRYDPAKYPGACPSCDEAIKDFKHFLTFPNPEHHKWHAASSIQKRNESLNTDPAVLDLLLWCLNHWLQEVLPSKTLEHYVVSWRDLETVTGLQFFPRWATPSWKDHADYLTQQQVVSKQQRIESNKSVQPNLLLLANGGSIHQTTSRTFWKRVKNGSDREPPDGLQHLCSFGNCR